MVEDKGLDPAVADRIGKFVNLKSPIGSPRELHAMLLDTAMFGDHAGSHAAMAELDTLFGYLEVGG